MILFSIPIPGVIKMNTSKDNSRELSLEEQLIVEILKEMDSTQRKQVYDFVLKMKEKK